MSSEPPILVPSMDGAGQSLRSAVSLAAASGRAFEILRVLHGRRHPGVHSLNSTVVAAVAEICGAELEGNDLHAERLVFRAGPLRPGKYEFDVGADPSGQRERNVERAP